MSMISESQDDSVLFAGELVRSRHVLRFMVTLLGAGLSCVSLGCSGERSSDVGGDAGGGAGVELRSCEDSERFASQVIDFELVGRPVFGEEDFPANVLGAPRGGGKLSGSLDVVSLGDGGFVVLGFGDAWIVDGPGPDFLVFENPFFIRGNEENPFAELGIVSVSEDGENWSSFPCTAESYPYGSCAGWNPVLAHVDDPDVDPFDPEQAGGDAFDLAELGLSRARYVKIQDKPGDGAVFDLDAVSIVHAECR